MLTYTQKIILVEMYASGVRDVLVIAPIIDAGTTSKASGGLVLIAGAWLPAFWRGLPRCVGIPADAARSCAFLRPRRWLDDGALAW
jgi:hypothetical protein